MLDTRFSHLYFYQSLNRLQRDLFAIAELLVPILTLLLFSSLFLSRLKRILSSSYLGAIATGFGGRRKRISGVKFHTALHWIEGVW